MAAQATRRGMLFLGCRKQRTQIGDEAVVSGHQFVELSSGADVLVGKTSRLARFRRPDRRGDDLFVNCAEYFAAFGEEARNRRKAMLNRSCPRGSQQQVRTSAG